MEKFVDVTFGEALEKFQEFGWLFVMGYTSVEFNGAIINAKRNINKIKELLGLDNQKFTLLDDNFLEKTKSTRFYVTHSEDITKNEKYDKYEETFIDFLIDAYSINHDFNSFYVKQKALEAYNFYIEEFRKAFNNSEYKNEIIGKKPFVVRKNALKCALKSIGESLNIDNIMERLQNICGHAMNNIIRSKKHNLPFLSYLRDAKATKKYIENYSDDKNSYKTELNIINNVNREMHKFGRYVSPEVAKLADNVCYNYLKSMKKENQEECNIQ